MFPKLKVLYLKTDLDKCTSYTYVLKTALTSNLSETEGIKPGMEQNGTKSN